VCVSVCLCECLCVPNGVCLRQSVCSWIVVICIYVSFVHTYVCNVFVIYLSKRLYSRFGIHVREESRREYTCVYFGIY